MRTLMAFLFSLWLVSTTAAAGVSSVYKGSPLSSVSAGSNSTSSAVEINNATFGSCQVIWTSLTGTINGTVKVQVSNDGTNWTDKSSASFTLSGASGNDVISLNGVVSENYFRVVYTKNSITNGTIHTVCLMKG